MSAEYEQQCQADARLVILAELAAQDDETLNSRNLAVLIDQVVPRKPVEWVEAQIAWLESMGAVTLRRSELAGLGTVAIATLTGTGRNHVERRTMLPGVTKPRS